MSQHQKKGFKGGLAWIKTSKVDMTVTFSYCLSSDIETKIRQRLHSHLTHDHLRTPYSPWQSGTSAMGRHWEAELDFPFDPYSEPDVDTHRTLWTDVLRTFPRQPRNWSPALLRLLDNKVPLRSDAQRANILDTIWAFTDA